MSERKASQPKRNAAKIHCSVNHDHAIHYINLGLLNAARAADAEVISQKAMLWKEGAAEIRAAVQNLTWIAEHMERMAEHEERNADRRAKEIIRIAEERAQETVKQIHRDNQKSLKRSLR